MTSAHDAFLATLPPAPALPPPTGTVVRVDSAIGIVRAIEDADEGSTIVIAPGRYELPRDCLLNTHRVTIRGETGDRDDVVLVGPGEFEDTNERFRTRPGGVSLIKLSQARGVTIADLTVADSPKYGIHFMGSSRIHDLLIHNVAFHNIWARGLKGTGAKRIEDHLVGDLEGDPEARLEWVRPRGGVVRHCLFIADHPKRNIEDGFKADYIAGLDLMNVADWSFHDNAFVGIRGKNGGGRGAIFVWQRSDRVTIERNRFLDCDRAISLGNPSGRDGNPYHIRDAVVRDNEIIGGSGLGIEVDHGDRVQVLDNRIESTAERRQPAIRVWRIETEAEVRGNRISHPGEAIVCDPEVRCVDNQVSPVANEVTR